MNRFSYLNTAVIGIFLAAGCADIDTTLQEQPFVAEKYIVTIKDVPVVENVKEAELQGDVPIADATTIPQTVATTTDTWWMGCENQQVPPWRANYIGSYAVLPTRFQDKGPDLYSFDISPDADVFHSEYLDPDALDPDELFFNDDDDE